MADEKQETNKEQSAEAKALAEFWKTRKAPVGFVIKTEAGKVVARKIRK